MNRTDFQNLALIRLTEAQALLASGNPSGAYYLAGYAVECALKACIAKETREHDFAPRPETVRDMYTHDVAKLVKVVGLKGALDSRSAAEPVFDRLWSIVSSWSEQARYATFTQAEADDLIDAINDPVHGVLSWLQQYW
jgi:hypothetical protein